MNTCYNFEKNSTNSNWDKSIVWWKPVDYTTYANNVDQEMEMF